MAYKNVIGIDISKRTMDLALFVDSEYEESFKIENSISALESFETILKQAKCNKRNTLLCCEEMGIYGTFIKEFCIKNKWKLCSESALKIHRSIGIIKGKNDKADAVKIADYAVKNQNKLKLYHPPRQIIEDIRFNRTALRHLEKSLKILQSTTKDKKYFKLQPISDAYVYSIQNIKKDIVLLNTKIDQIINNDTRLNNLFNIVTSIPGIGKKIFIELIIYTNEFKKFDTANQLASYCTIAPFKDKSGTSLNRRSKSSGLGNRNLKTILFLSVMSSLRNKKSHFYKYYIRKKEKGYTGYKLLNAIKNKIIHTIFACVQNMQQYEYNEI